MNIESYLHRIKYTDPIYTDNHTLINLHQHHIYSVPFENLDIYYKRIFTIEPEHLFKKVIKNNRGGFCYELNLLFVQLLKTLGFQARIISASIFDDFGNAGPEFDHMAVYVYTDRPFLADVGYGDLFIRPLEIKEGSQYDGSNFFKLEKMKENEYLVYMSDDGKSYKLKYSFHTEEVSANSFEKICLDKQVNPNSYFVKNLICTKPTNSGRITIFNNRLIEKSNNEKMEVQIENDDQLRSALEIKFGIKI